MNFSYWCSRNSAITGSFPLAEDSSYFFDDLFHLDGTGELGFSVDHHQGRGILFGGQKLPEFTFFLSRMLTQIQVFHSGLTWIGFFQSCFEFGHLLLQHNGVFWGEGGVTAGAAAANPGQVEDPDYDKIFL